MCYIINSFCLSKKKKHDKYLILQSQYFRHINVCTWAMAVIFFYILIHYNIIRRCALEYFQLINIPFINKKYALIVLFFFLIHKYTTKIFFDINADIL